MNGPFRRTEHDERGFFKPKEERRRDLREAKVMREANVIALENVEQQHRLVAPDREAGNEACTLPLVVSSSISPLHLALPIATVTPPFVVRPETHSLVVTSTLPLVVAASTTLFRSWPRIPPLVVIAFKTTPRGTFTLKLSLV